MAVGCQLLVDRLTQVKLLDDRRRTQVEHLLYGLLKHIVANNAGAEGLYHNGNRLGNADGIRQLNLAALCQTCRNNVLRNPAGRIRARAVHLGRVLAGKRAAAVTADAAVGVHDDLTAGQTGVAVRTADDETAGRVDEILGILIQQMGRNDLLYHLLDHVLANLREGHLRAVLGGNNNRIHTDGLIVLVILYGNLALAVRTEIVEHTVLAYLGQTLCQLVRQRDRHRHKLLGLIARITEHHALIACADSEVSLRGTLLALKGVVNAECNVGGLLVDGGQDSAGVAVKAVLRAVVADLTNRVADNLRDIHIAGSGNLAHYLNHTGGAGGLTGYAGIRILR